MRRLKILKFLLIAATAVALVTSALRYYRPTPEYDFLGGHKALFDSDPGVLGYLARDYSFRGTQEQVADVAEPELARPGYQRGNDGRSVSFEIDRVWVEPIEIVYISAGRTYGKHFAIDGDFLDSND